MLLLEAEDDHRSHYERGTKGGASDDRSEMGVPILFTPWWKLAVDSPRLTSHLSHLHDALKYDSGLVTPLSGCSPKMAVNLPLGPWIPSSASTHSEMKRVESSPVVL